MLVKPLNRPEKLRNAIFLAGPSPRSNESGCRWREEAIEIFNRKGFNGDLINPVNDNFSKTDLASQINWEVEFMMKSSLVFFWLPRTEEHPAFTTNVEFGNWVGNKSIVLGFPEGSIKNDYLKSRYEKENGRKVFNNMEEMIDWSINYLQNRKPNCFFTSDTHFSAERTLALSYRPFRDVEDMDLNLISNWNKKVTMNDVVYHLGDFGNQKLVHQLNFKKMYFVLGNYERRDFDVRELESDERVVILKDENEAYFQDPETKEYFNLIHEPVFETDDYSNSLIDELVPDDFYLYGHIHRLQMVKRNGINVGVDANRFEPMSLQEIKFLKNGIDNHFDENVFTESCKPSNEGIG